MHKPSINNNFSWDFPSRKMEPDVTTNVKLRRAGLYSLHMHLATPNTWHDAAVLWVYLPPQVAANEWQRGRKLNSVASPHLTPRNTSYQG